MACNDMTVTRYYMHYMPLHASQDANVRVKALLGLLDFGLAYNLNPCCSMIFIMPRTRHDCMT